MTTKYSTCLENQVSLAVLCCSYYHINIMMMLLSSYLLFLLLSVTYFILHIMLSAYCSLSGYVFCFPSLLAV